MSSVILIIFINLCGFILEYYGFDRHIILLGFRFHISLLVPCVLFFQKSSLIVIRESLSEFSLKKFLFFFMAAILPPIILTGGLYIFHAIELTDPDYFYELGLSSVADFPLYLLWNLPQMLILTLFLHLVTSSKKYKFPLLVLTLVSLFAFEFIPLGKEGLSLFSAADFLMAAVLFSVFFLRIDNVYYLAVYIFTVLWSNILLFGTENKALVNVLLAKNFDSWEGFFALTVNLFPGFAFLLQGGISLILLLFMFVVILKKDNFKAAETLTMETSGK